MKNKTIREMNTTQKLGEFELNKIYCIDCLEGLKKIPNNSVDLIVTDPPFCIEMDKIKENRSGRFTSGISDYKEQKELPYQKLSSYFFRVLKDNRHLYMFCDEKQIGKWFDNLTKVGFRFENVLVWDKKWAGYLLGSRGYRYALQTEFIIYCSKGRRKRNGDQFKSNVLRFSRVVKHHQKPYDKKEKHPTQKPIDLISEMIKESSREREIVLDAFIGTGTTALSCKFLNREFIGFELSPEYVKIANKRLAQEVLI